MVYKAWDLHLERFVAIKLLPDSVVSSPESIERFRREARAASAINHPNICTVYEIAEANGRSFIVMEYLEGTTLRGRIAAGPLDLALMLDLGIDIERAVVLGSDSEIQATDLPETIWEGAPALPGSLTYHAALSEAKKKIVTQALESTGGNYTEAARRLGVHVTYLHRLMKAFKMKAVPDESD